MNSTLRIAVGGLLAACLAAGAWAHEGGVIDLESLETYAAQQEAATAAGDPSVHKAWKKLDKSLDKAPKGTIASDLAKLKAASAAANGILVTDGNLRNLLDTGLDAADAALANSPDDVASVIGQIRKQSDRDKVVAAVQAAKALADDGRAARDGGDEAGQIKLWTKADGKFRKALSLARSLVNKQGGPLPQLRAAAAKRVYTVVGQGLGGFNGDGKEARRTQLYFVEECRVGPDGLLYILDWNNHMLRRRTADGRIERICGSGIPGDSEGAPMATDLNHPSSLVFDGVAGGKVYMAAWHNHKVKVYDPVGGAGGTPTVYTIAGTTQGGNTDVASGDGGLATQAKFNLLPGIVRLPNGDLLTADAANAVVRRIALSTGVDAPNLVGTIVRTGTITRFAGTRPVSGNTGDGGDALNCTLNFSKAQNAEPDGRMELSPDAKKLYIICGQANCIRVMDLDTGIIDRFAGTGTAGYEGDGGQARDAKLNRPSDIAVAQDGTVFVSDSFNNVIRRIAPDGTISTYAGSVVGAAGDAADDVPVAEVRFRHPAGLELDQHGNLYVCDRETSVIRVITSDAPGPEIQLPVEPFVLPSTDRGGPPARGTTGTIATYAGTGTLGFNGDGRGALDTDFYWPQDVAVDPSPVTPFLNVVDWNNHRIRRIESDGTVKTVVGSGLLGDAGGEGPDAKLNHPTDITFHPATGDLWIAAWHTDKIIRLDSATNRIVYMAGNKRGFTGDGGVTANPIEGSPTVGVAEMNIPASVKFTASGDWYVSDQGNQRIRKVVGTTGIIDTIVGNGTGSFSGENVPGLQATINLPVGQAAQPAGRVAISPDDHWLYLADTNNHRIRRIDLTSPDFTITTLAGNGAAGFSGDGGPATLAKLSSPCDVDCDAAGNVYVADRDNNVVRRIDVQTNVITTFAGTGFAGYSGDGSTATHARFDRPCGLFVVRSGIEAGRVYVADTYNGVVRVIWE